MKKIFSIFVMIVVFVLGTDTTIAKEYASADGNEVYTKVAVSNNSNDKLIPFTIKDEEKYLEKMMQITTKKLGPNRITSPHKTSSQLIWYCGTGSGKFFKLSCNKNFTSVNVVEVKEEDIPYT